MDLEKLYLKVVVKANRGRLRDIHHTIIDYEVNRMSIELGIGSAFWLNPLFIKEEDRKYFPKEALVCEKPISGEKK